MLEPPSTYCKCPIFFHKTPLDLGGINPPRFTTMRLLFENGVLSFLSLQGAKAAVGNMLKTRRSKEKKEQQKSFNFERSRGSEDIGSTIPKKILCSWLWTIQKAWDFLTLEKTCSHLAFWKNPSCHWPCASAPLKEMRKAGWFDVFSGTAERHGTIHLSSNIDLEKFQQISRCEFCSIWPPLPSRSCLFGR